MQAVVQRVSRSSVSVDDNEISAIGKGLMVLLGVTHSDSEQTAGWMADKIVHLRIFEDANGKMNHSLIEVKGSLMVISQFTLLGDCRKGRRPSFINAAPPDQARSLYHHFVHRARQMGVNVVTGKFRATMQVSLINDGPVTMIVSSP